MTIRVTRDQSGLMKHRISIREHSLVTDVDTTTAANLIDSMSTEVLQTDYSIQDVVPGEPMSYADAVRAAVADQDAG